MKCTTTTNLLGGHPETQTSLQLNEAQDTAPTSVRVLDSRPCTGNVVEVHSSSFFRVGSLLPHPEPISQHIGRNNMRDLLKIFGVITVAGLIMFFIVAPNIPILM